jgi:hypothetical protein
VVIPIDPFVYRHDNRALEAAAIESNAQFGSAPCALPDRETTRPRAMPTFASPLRTVAFLRSRTQDAAPLLYDIMISRAAAEARSL